MTQKIQLTKNITEAEFDHGYWYADEIKTFAKSLGIAHSSKLRKDELEKLIKHFIRTGKIKDSKRKNVVKTGPKDLDIGLSRTLPIKHYTSNKQTKGFILEETQKLTPDFKIKPGVWYRLNRWRDEQVSKNKKITYGDLVNQFIKLNKTEGKFEKAVSGRYINFVSEFLEKEPGASKERAIKIWKQLKDLDVPKDYTSWKIHIKKSRT